MLSLTCKIAIKAVIYLASRYDTGTNAGIREIAAAIGASEHTVGKLLQQLVKSRLVNSVKGPSGGFFLTREQQTRPLLAIIEAIDGPTTFNECGLGLSKCSDTHPCPIHQQYKPMLVSFKSLCKNTRIGDISGKVNSGLVHLIG